LTPDRAGPNVRETPDRRNEGECGMARGLLIVDIQRDYFPGGRFPLVGPEPAAEAAASVLRAFRESGDPVIHVRHESEPDAPFMRPGTPGVEIHPLVAPDGGEPVITKHAPNSFLDTPLLERLREMSISELTVTGMMTSMCVDATVRAAADLGFSVTVVHNACAAPDLTFNGLAVPAAAVHAAFLAALAGGYANVVGSEDIAAG
jgi:nicotinamidase-related amidase